MNWTCFGVLNNDILAVHADDSWISSCLWLTYHLSFRKCCCMAAGRQWKEAWNWDYRAQQYLLLLLFTHCCHLLVDPDSKVLHGLDWIVPIRKLGKQSWSMQLHQAAKKNQEAITSGLVVLLVVPRRSCQPVSHSCRTTTTVSSFHVEIRMFICDWLMHGSQCPHLLGLTDICQLPFELA